MKRRQIFVEDLVNQFNMIVVTGHNRLKEKEITVPEVNRPGLELLGYYEFCEQQRIGLVGNKELSFLATLDAEQQRVCYEFLTADITPTIIVTQGHLVPQMLLDIAKNKNFIILRTPKKTSILQSDILTYLSEKLAPAISLHGTLIDMFGMGVLLTGESGIGKSEIALELVRKGHRIVADDRVDIIKFRNELIGFSPEELSGFMEVRGLGIINIKKVLGINAFTPSKKITYIINLTDIKNGEFDRLGTEMTMESILNVPVVSARLPVSSGRSMSELLEVAVTTLRLRDEGEISATEFEEKYQQFLIGK